MVTLQEIDEWASLEDFDFLHEFEDWNGRQVFLGVSIVEEDGEDGPVAQRVNVFVLDHEKEHARPLDEGAVPDDLYAELMERADAHIRARMDFAREGAGRE